MQLRDWLIEARKAAGLTQRQLAERLQIVHSLVGKVEKGERRLDVIEFKTYCEVLDVSPNDFFDLLDNKSN
ncbi:MAG: helix-turn-helix domain-containing protein [Ghiorsea sp.]|nr:helix-turn-helix domain-containing protein [Ghiorsea sp.]